MKNLFVFGFLMIACAGNAQINKGNVLAGGTIGYNSTKTGDIKTSTFDFSPNLGYFFIDNLAAGLRLDLQSSNTDAGLLEVESSSTLIAPFLRYYFLPAGEKLNVFADASAGFGSTKLEDRKRSTTAFSIAAGPAYFLTPSVALEFQVGYNSTKVKDQDDKTNDLGVGLGLQIHLGK